MGWIPKKGGSKPGEFDIGDVYYTGLQALIVGGAAGLGFIVNNAAHLEAGAAVASIVATLAAAALKALERFNADNSSK